MKIKITVKAKESLDEARKGFNLTALFHENSAEKEIIESVNQHSFVSRQSWILDSTGGFRIPGTGFGILCPWNLDSRHQSSLRFQIPRIPESELLYMGRIAALPRGCKPRIGIFDCAVLFQAYNSFISLVAYDYNTNGDKFHFQRSRNFAIY